MRLIVRAQRSHQRRRQRFHQQTLGYLGGNQDEYAITAVLATTVIPRDPSPAERLSHHAIQAIADRHLVHIGAAMISEPLDVDDDDGPVNGKPLVLHLPTRPEQGRDILSLLQA